MKKLSESIEDILKAVQNETEIFLDSLELETPYSTPSLEISFNGIKAEIPIDYAETNNEIQVFLEGIADVIKGEME
jgi:hypothetical protein